jgi:GNAT superfamily N-acetyltransferase
MTPRYEIVLARPRDVLLIGSIELAAARLLRGYAPEPVLNEVTSERDLRDAQRNGCLWVALEADTPVGFAHVKIIEPNAVHLDELDVHPDHGRRGLGTRLVKAVCAWARARGDVAVTLATFREIPWNMPFYARLGFEAIPAGALSPALRAVVDDEAHRGLDPARRVVMQWRPQLTPGVSD